MNRYLFGVNPTKKYVFLIVFMLFFTAFACNEAFDIKNPYKTKSDFNSKEKGRCSLDSDCEQDGYFCDVGIKACVNPCDTIKVNNCEDNAHCISLNLNDTSCYCNYGYVGDDFSCIKVDETYAGVDYSTAMNEYGGFHNAPNFPNIGAFVALRPDGSIVAWGNAGFGGNGAPIETDFVKIYSNEGAFAALKSDGSIVAWGSTEYGGSVAPVETDFVKIYSTHGAFAALKSNGSIVTWGSSFYGGSGGGEVLSGTGFVKIYSTTSAFAALKSDGSILAWGNSGSGGHGEPTGTGFVKIYSTQAAFAALKSDGSIVGWGTPETGDADAPLGTGYTIPYGDQESF